MKYYLPTSDLTSNKVYEKKYEAFLMAQKHENIIELEVVESSELFLDTNPDGTIFLMLEDGTKFEIVYETFQDEFEETPESDTEYFDEVDDDKIYIILERWKKSVNIRSVGFSNAEIEQIIEFCKEHLNG